MPQPDTPAYRLALLREALVQIASVAPSETGKSGETLRLRHKNRFEEIYLSALSDWLVVLGIVERTAPGELRVVSFQAGYGALLLLALIETDTPLVADWTHEGVSADSSAVFHTGVDLLHALEQRRLEVAPNSPPLRTVQAAIGLIGKRGGEPAFLLVWDTGARMWQFIGGRFDISDASLRATMLRELAEELGCPPFTASDDVALTELGPPFEEQRVSPTFGMLTRTLFQAYAVRLRQLPPLAENTRWVTDTEFVRGTTGDGQPIAAAPYLRVRDLALGLFDSFAIGS